LAHGEGRVDPRAAAADAYAFEGLQPLLVALAHAHHHPHRVARIKSGNVGLQPFPLDRPQSVHTLTLDPHIGPTDRAAVRASGAQLPPLATPRSPRGAPSTRPPGHPFRDSPPAACTSAVLTIHPYATRPPPVRH